MGDAMDEQFELKNYREILVDDGMTNQHQVDVMAAITKASVIVSKSYSHSSDEIILTNPEEWQD